MHTRTPQTGRDRGAPRQFRLERLARIAEMERWHFWFVGRRSLVLRLIRRYVPVDDRIVDLGCGSGLLVEHLRRHGYEAIGFDRLAGSLQNRAGRSHTQTALAKADVLRVPLADGAADAVVILDVLEHVDDLGALAEARRILSPGGVMVVSVPAMPWLWSYRDEDAGHRRRYARRQFQSVLTRAGVRLERLQGYQCLAFPLVAATRLLGRRGPRLRNAEERRWPVLNEVLGWVNRAEASLGSLVAWPWGTSWVAVCREPGP